MRVDELEKAIEEQKREPKKEGKKIIKWYYVIIIILIIIAIILPLWKHTDIFECDDPEKKEGIITLKYEISKTKRVFEIDNETLVRVSQRHYLKYEVGDNYTYYESQITNDNNCIIIYPITFLFCSVFLIKRLEEKP